jgi:hypothetical protein
MDDDSMLLPSYVTSRKGVYQYVRRVPDDVADVFSAARIQRSLKTRVLGEARQRAAQLEADIERRSAEARRRKGIAITLRSTAGWTWKDWSQVVEWLRATWLSEDQSARLRKSTGADFSADPRRTPLWRNDKEIREKLDLRKRLLGFSVTQYALDRTDALNAALAPISLTVPMADPTRGDFMATCLKAEIEALELIFRREAGEIIDDAHRGETGVTGPFRRRHARALRSKAEAESGSNRTTHLRD